MDNCLISVILPTFNRGYIIGKAIQSVLEQTISNWELIIVDDASTDNTEDIVKSFNDSRIIFAKNERNMGANFARNRGCTIAKGEFFAFLDSDNVWVCDKLERQLESLLHSEEDVAFVFSRGKIIDGNTKVVPDKNFKISLLEKILHRQNVIDTNTVLLKRSVFEDVGGFDNNMPRIQDWDIFFRIIVVYHYKAIYIPKILDFNVMQPNSISKSDYRYQKAISIFLKKYRNYLNTEEIAWHISGLLRQAEDKNEALLFVKEFINNEDIKIDNLYIAMAEKFYEYSQYYSMLLLWKNTMEKTMERTIFSSNHKWKDLTIALYGLGIWGELIYKEAHNCGITIQYGIDKKAESFYDIKIVDLQEIPESVDLIIVSIFQEYNEVCQEISQYYLGEIISIKDLIIMSSKW